MKKRPTRVGRRPAAGPAGGFGLDGTVVGASETVNQDQQPSPAERARELAVAIGEVVRFRRNLLDMSDQKDLLLRLRVVKQSQLSDIEHGKRPPKLEALLDVCTGLNVPLATLIRDAELSLSGGLPVGSFYRQNDSYDARLGHAVAEKSLIAEYVAFVLRTEYEGQTVGIDGGTTNELIGQAIGRQAVAQQTTVSSIVTNNLCIPDAVSVKGPAPFVNLTGGLYRPERRTLIGSGAVETVRNRTFKASVIGANGFDYPCLYTGGGSENDVKLAFIEQASDLLCPLDPSKWRRQTADRPLVNLLDLVQKKKIVSLFTVCPGTARQADSRGDRPAFAGVLDVADQILEGGTPCTIECAVPSFPFGRSKPAEVMPRRLTGERSERLREACRAMEGAGTETGLVIRFRLGE